MIHIENYISGFLLKNKYCAISGLGTLNLKRESAQVRSSEEDVYPPNYKISFSPIGVIDDGFATFIANHENVSISKASNDIKTFTQDVKHDLKKTGRYELTGVGHFTYKNDSIQFVQDDTLDLQQDPIKIYQEPQIEDDETLANAGNFKDLNYTHSEKGMSRPKASTLLKYLFSFLLLIGLAVGAYFAYNHFKEIRLTDTLNDGVANIEESDSSNTTLDENSNEGSESSASNGPATVDGEYNVAVFKYSNEASAKSKAKKLTTYGNKATAIKKGNQHYVIITASHPSNDTTVIKDSLRKFFNPSGSPFVVK